MKAAQRRHGFRFSGWDALILLAGAGLFFWLRSMEFPLAWLVPIAVGHFFLFCNVFLVWLRWEIVWTVLFLANVGSHLWFGELGWLPPLLWQLPVTLVVVVMQMRSPWYHGIFAGRLNPRLSEYLDGSL